MRRSLIPLFALVLLLPACADAGPDASEDPKGALTSAFERMAESEGITMGLTVQSDEASLQAFSEGKLSEEHAGTVLESSLTISSTNPEDPKDVEFEMTADVAGDLVEVKQIGQTAYLRADVRDLVTRFGGDETEIDQTLAQMPPEYSFFEAGVEGEWIALTGAEALQEQMGAPTPDQKLQKQIADDLIKAVEESAEVRSEGSDDIGDHLVATIQIRPLFASFTDAVGSLGALGIPGGQMPSATDVPDEALDVHFWVEDDWLTQVELDMTQFEGWEGAEDFPEGVERMALRLTFEEFDGGVEAPDAAEEVDIMQLLQTFMGDMGSGMTPPETSTGEGQSTIDDLCKSLEGAPPEVVEQFASECPELQP